MSSAQVYQPRDVEAGVAYWAEYNNQRSPAVDNGIRIMHGLHECDIRRMTFHDIRNVENEHTLDKNGFQILVLPRTPDYLVDEEQIRSRVYPQVTQRLREITGTNKVFIFNHVIRGVEGQPDRYNPEIKSIKGPAKRPHSDFHGDTCAEFFSNAASGHRPGLAALIQSGRRWQILGWWRPLQIIRRDPLALLDARTVPDSDFVPVSREFNGRKGATSIVRYGKGNHRWCYLHEQRPDEVVVFKQFDSLRRDGLAWRCAHTSFRIPGTEYLPPRQSIEFRAFVFYD